LPGRAEDVALGRAEADLVRPRGQAGEAIVAVGVGDGGGGHRATGIIERDRHPCQAQFPGVLQAIQVGVVPDEVAEAGRQRCGSGGRRRNQVDAGVPGEVVGRRHRDKRRTANGPAGREVGVERVITARISRAELPGAARQLQLDEVLPAGRQPAELVAAAAVGCRRSQHRPHRVQQAQRQPG